MQNGLRGVLDGDDLSLEGPPYQTVSFIPASDGEEDRQGNESSFTWRKVGHVKEQE